jgi:hypothetical protein
VVLAILVVGSWLWCSDVFGAGVLQGQISTDTTTGEQSPESDKTGREIGGGHAPRGQNSPKTLVEAVQRAHVDYLNVGINVFERTNSCFRPCLAFRLTNSQSVSALHTGQRGSIWPSMTLMLATQHSELYTPACLASRPVFIIFSSLTV